MCEENFKKKKKSDMPTKDKNTKCLSRKKATSLPLVNTGSDCEEAYVDISVDGQGVVTGPTKLRPHR